MNAHELVASRELSDAAAIIAQRGDGVDANVVLGWSSDPVAHRSAIEVRALLPTAESFWFRNALAAIAGVDVSSANTYTIPQKMSNSGSIHDIASENFDRDIYFAPGCLYAVVLASYYGGKGYTTHRTEEAAIAASRKNGEYSHQIIDAEGNVYGINGDHLCRI